MTPVSSQQLKILLVSEKFPGKISNSPLDSLLITHRLVMAHCGHAWEMWLPAPMI